MWFEYLHIIKGIDVRFHSYLLNRHDLHFESSKSRILFFTTLKAQNQAFNFFTTLKVLKKFLQKNFKISKTRILFFTTLKAQNQAFNFLQTLKAGIL